MITPTECFADLLSQLDAYVVDDPALCPNGCGHRYKGKWRKYNLKSHLLYECGVPRQFRCHLCHKSFSQKTTLKMHVAKIHKILMNNYWIYTMYWNLNVVFWFPSIASRCRVYFYDNVTSVNLQLFMLSTRV